MNGTKWFERTIIRDARKQKSGDLVESGARTTDWYFMKIIVVAIWLGSVHAIRVHNCVLNTDVREPPVFVDHVCWKPRSKVLGHTRLVEFRMFLCGDFEYFGVRNRRETTAANGSVRFVCANYILFRLYRSRNNSLLWGEGVIFISIYKFDSWNQNVQLKMSWLLPPLSKTAAFLSRFDRAYFFHLLFSLLSCRKRASIHHVCRGGGSSTRATYRALAVRQRARRPRSSERGKGRSGGGKRYGNAHALRRYWPISKVISGRSRFAAESSPGCASGRSQRRNGAPRRRRRPPPPPSFVVAVATTFRPVRCYPVRANQNSVPGARGVIGIDLYPRKKIYIYILF